MRTQHLHIKVVCLYIFILCATGCAKQTTVVLLPDPSGKVGKVIVASDAGSVDITEAQQATTVKGRQSLPSQPKVLSDKTIQRDFEEALAALPEQPVHFILYFQQDSKKLTDASQNIIPEILSTTKERHSQNISVIGHTDTTGDPAYNLRLSKQRAQAIGQILIGEGIKQRYIKTTSHGENNPLIPTADNVAEPKNRRVEVVVR